MTLSEIKDLLDTKYHQFNTTNFIETDPISIPHLFTKKEDIEIIGFLVATFSWGQRNTILKNGKLLCTWMENEPHQFISSFTKTDLKPFKKFVHRTMNGDDMIYFLESLQHIYKNYGGLEPVLATHPNYMQKNISEFKKLFFENPHLNRTEKHIADPMKNSSAKRICMYLRWMVRKDKYGVDFGIWKKIKPSQLYAPLDLHSGGTARKLEILNRKQDDWKSVVEITDFLKKLDPKDPIKYDYALYGLGVFEKF